jgi:hypothetical protein
MACRFVSWRRDIPPSPDAKQTPQSTSRHEQAIFALSIEISFPHVLQTGVFHVINTVVHHIAHFGTSVPGLAVWTLPATRQNLTNHISPALHCISLCTTFPRTANLSMLFMKLLSSLIGEAMR